MTLHVDAGAKRSAPFPDDIQARLKEMHTAHSGLPRPAQLGHLITIPRKSG